MIEKINNEEEIVIRALDDVQAVRRRPGMYIGDNSNASIILREIIDNTFDESYACKYCNNIFVDTEFNGYNIVADNGRGLPISMSQDDPLKTQALLAVSKLHAGSKFSLTSNTRTGMNGVGSSVCNFMSESFIVMSKITEENWNTSIPAVAELWQSQGPRSKRDLFYVIVFERGYLVYEGAYRKADLEAQAFRNCPKGYSSIPSGFSTIILFKPDPEMFVSTKTMVPDQNIQYFLLIQEKFYKKKVKVIANSQEYSSSSLTPWKYEILRTIIPADTSLNDHVSVYVTFEVDPGLTKEEESGSVNGLVVNQGVHIQNLEACYEAALRSEYGIKHRCIFNGLKMKVIVLASEVVFDSQTKTRLKSISKVQKQDFIDISKEFIKIFRSDPQYWTAHVEKLNYLAESMRSLTSLEKAEKLKAGNTVQSSYKLRNELGSKLNDCTAPPQDRWKCELFLTEGNSAAGSLVTGRKDCRYHAIMPLRGRVLNTEGMDVDQMLENKEMYTIFRALGTGLDINNVASDAQSLEEGIEILKRSARFGKIIISTDADADGSIIASGLLYTISRFARYLIEYGMVFLIESPSFSQAGRYFFPSDPTVDGEIPVGLDTRKHFKRYKGLGSLNPPEIYDAFFDPTKRRLIQVTPDGIDYANGLVEDIQNRRNLLVNNGLLSNPFNLQ